MINNHWETARKLFREACFLRSMGDEKGAIGILSKDMPGTVSAWMADSQLTARKKKEQQARNLNQEIAAGPNTLAPPSRQPRFETA